MTALLDDPRVRRALAHARGGALGEVTGVELTRALRYPAYEGGPLPAHRADAGAPFREYGGEALALIRSLLGPIEDVDAAWRSTGGDPDLAFDEWKARVRCERGLGRLELAWGAGGASELVVHGTKGISRTALGRASLLDRLRGAAAPVALEEDGVGAWVGKVARAAEADRESALARFPRSASVPFLVTGAAGNLGRAIVARLRADGHAVRVFQRRVPERPAPGLEYAFGNLGDPDAVDRAVDGARVVIHAGAALKGGWPEHLAGTVIGTQNVLDACARHRVKQLVHVSSMSVIDWAGSSDQGAVDETAPLEPHAGKRGAYTRAKLEAEQRVSAAAAAGLPCVILRPGQIFGGGIPLVNGAVARGAAGRWLVLGDGALELPLVYLDDVVDAILLAVERGLAHGEIIQIIDPEHLTQDDVLAAAGGSRGVVRVPRPLVFALGKLSEWPLAVLGRPSPIALYRLKSALARLHYDSDRAQKLLGWSPRVGVREGMRRR